MTDNDIMKALECRGVIRDCVGCPKEKEPYDCYFVLCGGAIDLINRQKAEIEKKDTEIDILIRKNETLKDENFELKAEVERLQNQYPCKVKVGNLCEVWANSLDDYDKFIGSVSAEGIKEVADSLQSILDEHTLQNGDVHFVALYKAVEKLTKELTE